MAILKNSGMRANVYIGLQGEQVNQMGQAQLPVYTWKICSTFLPQFPYPCSQEWYYNEGGVVQDQPPDTVLNKYKPSLHYRPLII